MVEPTKRQVRLLRAVRRGRLGYVVDRATSRAMREMVEAGWLEAAPWDGSAMLHAYSLTPAGLDHVSLAAPPALIEVPE